MNYKKAFTLPELLAVVAIIGIITSVILVNLSISRGKARDTRRIADLYHYSELLRVCLINNGSFPNCEINDVCDDTTTTNYRYISSCNCGGGQFQNTILMGCPPVTLQELPNDPINWNPWAYYFLYFPSTSLVDPACKSKYVLMANLEKIPNPSRVICTTDTGVFPHARQNSFWIILGP